MLYIISTFIFIFFIIDSLGILVPKTRLFPQFCLQTCLFLAKSWFGSLLLVSVLLYLYVNLVFLWSWICHCILVGFPELFFFRNRTVKKMMSSGMNLITTVIAFAMSVFFILFICSRIICGRIRGSQSTQMFQTQSEIDLQQVHFILSTQTFFCSRLKKNKFVDLWHGNVHLIAFYVVIEQIHVEKQYSVTRIYINLYFNSF